MIRIAGVLGAAAASICAGVAAAQSLGVAIVVRDQAVVRATPRDSGQQQALLWQGEVVEVRAERLDHLQVYDYRRERGGFVRASHLRRLDASGASGASAAETAELLSILRFVRDTPGAEALGIGFAVAYIQEALADTLRGPGGIEALDALGTAADRLAERASSGASGSKAAAARLAAHLDVATGHGVRFTSHERAGRMQVCYDGDAFRRVLSMRSTAGQRARAALALTRHECVNPDLGPAARGRVDEWRADVLERVDPSALPAYLMNRVAMRRASVWASIAYARARSGESAEAAARRALGEFAAVRKPELTDEDLAGYNSAAMRVNAARWAAQPPAPAAPQRRLYLAAAPGQPGETCIALRDARNGPDAVLARRCTYGLVWPDSATTNREASALAVAVQPADGWLELWIFRKGPRGWTVSVLPPAPVTPELGYAEFAGWVPGGAEVLVAREARGEGKYRRSFEVVRLDTLAVARQSGDPAALGPFQRWQDPAWKAATLSLR
jgi:hypothetical protein